MHNHSATKMRSGRFRELLKRTFEQWQRSFPFKWCLLPHPVAAPKAHAIALTAILLFSTTVTAETLRVRVLDAHNGRPVSGEKVNVHVQGMRDDVTYTTDANGTFVADVSRDARLGVSTEWRVTCLDGKSTALPMFSAGEILRSGVIMPNTCGKAKTELIPGTITIFTRKATLFENMAR